MKHTILTFIFYMYYIDRNINIIMYLIILYKIIYIFIFLIFNVFFPFLHLRGNLCSHSLVANLRSGVSLPRVRQGKRARKL